MGSVHSECLLYARSVEVEIGAKQLIPRRQVRGPYRRGHEWGRCTGLGGRRAAH